jgi:hypothetical protein
MAIHPFFPLWVALVVLAEREEVTIQAAGGYLAVQVVGRSLSHV